MSNADQETTTQPAPSVQEQSDPKEKGQSEGKQEKLGHVLAESEETLKRFGDEARDEVKRPTFGAAIAGATVVGAAAIWGVAEAAVGALTAYVVFRILKKRRA